MKTGLVMEEAQPRPPRHPLRNPGCVIALVIWFLVLLSPCFLIVLAVRSEISITTGSAPEQRMRVWVIQEAGQSGVGFSNVDVKHTSDEALCVQTNVNFLLWRGKAESTQYCECYEQAESGWQTTSVEQGVCSAP
jgi:hypothetical protein